MRIEYRLSYKEYKELGGKGGYILRNPSFDTKEQLKEFIKDTIKDEDVILSIIEVKIKRLNVKDFR